MSKLTELLRGHGQAMPVEEWETEQAKKEDDMNMKSQAEVTLQRRVKALRKALNYYRHAEVVTSWGAQETSDDGAVAREALKADRAAEKRRSQSHQ